MAMQPTHEQRLAPLQQVFVDFGTGNEADRERVDRRHTICGYIPHAFVERHNSSEFQRKNTKTDDTEQRSLLDGGDRLFTTHVAPALTRRHSTGNRADTVSATSTETSVSLDAVCTASIKNNGYPSSVDSCSDAGNRNAEEPRGDGNPAAGCNSATEHETDNTMISTARELAERTRQAVLARRQRQHQRQMRAATVSDATEIPRLLGCLSHLDPAARASRDIGIGACDRFGPSARPTLLGRVGRPGCSGSLADVGRSSPRTLSSDSEGGGQSPAEVAARRSQQAFLARVGRRTASRDFSTFDV